MFWEMESETPQRSHRHRICDDVLFDFPPDEFKLASFSSIANLKQALQTAGSGPKASFSFSSNSRYVGVRCKVPKCPAFFSYKIELTPETEGKVLRVNKFRNHHSHSAKYQSKNRLAEMVEYLE
jgi:hypothetical protein